MRTLAALALAILTACGAGGAPGRHVSVRVAASLPDGLVGWTELEPGEDPRVYVLAGLDADTTAAVVAHELWHAMTGRTDHPAASGGGFFGCMSDPEVRVGVLLSGVACSADLVDVPAGDWTVDAGELLAACSRAAAFWNRALGRDALVIE